MSLHEPEASGLGAGEVRREGRRGHLNCPFQTIRWMDTLRLPRPGAPSPPYPDRMCAARAGDVCHWERANDAQCIVGCLIVACCGRGAQRVHG